MQRLTGANESFQLTARLNTGQREDTGLLTNTRLSQHPDMYQTLRRPDSRQPDRPDGHTETAATLTSRTVRFDALQGSEQSPVSKTWAIRNENARVYTWIEHPALTVQQAHEDNKLATARERGRTD